MPNGPDTRPFDAASSLLLTDLYELNMLDAYLQTGMTETAVFEFFVRRLPESRGFLVAAGLEQALAFLEGATFWPDEIEWLASMGQFSDQLLTYLADFQFTGDVDAMAEGSIFFPDEPILRLSAPLPEAQLLETRLINILHFQTVIASKAARMVLAAPGKLLLDFGLRRAHGAEAGLLAARASYLAGFDGTATTLAGQRFGIPVYGTMAHSFVQAHETEMQAFEAFARTRPDNLILLIDTYDTEVGAARAVAMAQSLAGEGIRLFGVRLDSGDLAAHARQVRRILDRGGQREVRIFASGGIDETVLAQFSKQDAPIDGYGIGTSVGTSSDAPALDCAYKLQSYAGKPKRKRSEGKATWPGAKQVYRHHDKDGVVVRDTLTLVDDTQSGEPRLSPQMRGGQRVGTEIDLAAARLHARCELQTLPPPLLGLASAPSVDVIVSDALRACADMFDRGPT